MRNNVMKPMSVARSEFIQSITKLINDSALPPFVIEAILKDLYADVHTLTQRQLELETKAYLEAMGEEVGVD